MECLVLQFELVDCLLFVDLCLLYDGGQGQIEEFVDVVCVCLDDLMSLVDVGDDVGDVFVGFDDVDDFRFIGECDWDVCLGNVFFCLFVQMFWMFWCFEYCDDLFGYCCCYVCIVGEVLVDQMWFV